VIGAGARRAAKALVALLVLSAACGGGAPPPPRLSSGPIDGTGEQGAHGELTPAERRPREQQADTTTPETAGTEITVVRIDPARMQPPPATSPSRGPADAPVVVQLFSDFECPFCARALPAVHELERGFKGRVRIVWRNYPLPFHTHARMAARAALEAQAQRGNAGFWSMHDRIYEHAPNGLDERVLERLAGEIGLEPARFRAAIRDTRHDPAIDRDLAAGDALGIEGTPAFLVNDYYLMGLQPPGTLSAVAEQALRDRGAE